MNTGKQDANTYEEVQKMAYEALDITTYTHAIVIIFWLRNISKGWFKGWITPDFYDAFLIFIVMPVALVYLSILMLFLTRKYRILRRYGVNMFLFRYSRNTRTALKMDLERVDKSQVVSCEEHEITNLKIVFYSILLIAMSINIYGYYYVRS